MKSLGKRERNGEIQVENILDQSFPDMSAQDPRDLVKGRFRWHGSGAGAQEFIFLASSTAQVRLPRRQHV